MFSNLPMEIIYYSAIPVGVIVIIDFLMLIFLRKKNRPFRLHYLIEISLIIMIGLVLPVIIGYTVWIINTFLSHEILENNILYVALLIFLCLIMFILLIWVYLKALKNLSINDENKKLESN